MNTSDILEALNPVQQQAAAFMDDGHCLILAGAGSGKTRVITHRIAYLICEKNIDPYCILAITFTNKAAAEMRERTIGLLKGKASIAGLTISTFHAFGAYFLRKNARYANLTPDFTIYDEDDQKSFLKKILKDQGQSAELIKSNLSPMLHAFEQFKEQALTSEQIQERAKSRTDEEYARLYELYNQQLQANNAVDFADLIYLPVKILSENRLLQHMIQDRFQHILVDEFQDTNPAQIRLLKMLCGEESKITAVGDDDQSIYAWRGADPNNILHFEEIFGKTTCFKLEQNYRSTQPILNTANALISNALKDDTFKKKLWTSEKATDKVVLVEYDDDRDEACDIVSDILSKKAGLGLKNSDFAILFRTNNQSRLFETTLREKGFQNCDIEIVGGISFFARADIKDLLAYLRILVNPCDAIALARVIQAPKRGIGDKAYQKLSAAVQNKRLSGTPEEDCLVSALQDVVSGTLKIGNKPAVEGCRELLQLLREIRDMKSEKPSSILDHIVDSVQFIDYLRKSADTPESFDEATQRVDDLFDILKQFEENPENTLSTFLEQMALLQPEKEEKKSSDTIKLMTIHAAKGLEFPVVYLTGFEDNLLPLSRNGERDLEEERRLAYVAITRAKRFLTISHAGYRRRYQGFQAQMPSCFIKEIRKNLPNFQQNISEKFGSIGGESVSKNHFVQCAPQPFYSDFTRQERPARTAPKLAFTKTKPAAPKPEKSFDFDDIPESMEGFFRKYRNAKAAKANDAQSDAVQNDIFPDYENESQDWERTASAANEKNGAFLAGTRVSHIRYGIGEVISSTPCAEGYKVEVDFPMAGKHTIISKFLKRI